MRSGHFLFAGNFPTMPRHCSDSEAIRMTSMKKIDKMQEEIKKLSKLSYRIDTLEQTKKRLEKHNESLLKDFHNYQKLKSDHEALKSEFLMLRKMFADCVSELTQANKDLKYYSDAYNQEMDERYGY